MIAAHTGATERHYDRKAIDQTVRERLDRWRELLATKHVTDGRQLLREVLTGPLQFTPDGRRYRFEGDAGVRRLLAGMADATYVVRPEGLEPPAYRFEACRSIQLSYGRVPPILLC